MQDTSMIGMSVERPKKNLAVHFSSNSDEWQTPPEVYDPLNREFAFTLDAAASAENHLVTPYLTEEIDALEQDWGALSTVWSRWEHPCNQCLCPCHRHNELASYNRGLLDLGDISPKTAFQAEARPCFDCQRCVPHPGAVWLNPPYSMLKAFMRKTWEEAQRGTTIVALLPARTDTIAFHDYILGKAQIRFIRGRIRFVGSQNSAPFPSMVVVYTPQYLPPQYNSHQAEKLHAAYETLGSALFGSR